MPISGPGSGTSSRLGEGRTGEGRPEMPIDARHPKEIRADIRAGRLTTVTTGLAPGFVQANLAVLPKEQAYDFLLFCQRNPRPCPLIEVTDVGSPRAGGVDAGGAAAR